MLPGTHEHSIVRYLPSPQGPFGDPAVYEPLFRMLPAQILAGTLLAIALALPLIARYIVTFNLFAIGSIICGAALIVLLAVCLGIVSGGKKLFEIVFFMLAYAATQKIPAIDYIGATPHDNHTSYLSLVLMLILGLGLISFVVRNYQARHL